VVSSLISYYLIFLVGFLVFAFLFLGSFLQDRWFSVLAGMVLMIFGLYVVLNGLDFVDPSVTGDVVLMADFLVQAFWMACVGIGGVILLYNVLKLVEEGGL
jgi:hypothetical protein